MTSPNPQVREKFVRGWTSEHNNTGPKPLFTSEGNLHGGLGSMPFRITPARWCGNGCPHVRPHPGLTNLEFGRVYCYFRYINSGERPWV